jgi:hypothetical protein
MIQGHSSETTKLRLAINVVGPFLLCMGAGFVWLIRERRMLPSILLVAALSVVLTLATRALEYVHFPVDPREYAAHPDIPREGDVEYELVRREAIGVSLLPGNAFLTIVPLIEPGRFAQIADEMVNDRFEAHPESIPQALARYFQPQEWRKIYEPHLRWGAPPPQSFPRAQPTILRLDLSQPPTRNPAFLTRVSEVPTSKLDLTNLSGRLLLENRQADVHEAAIDLLFTRVRGGEREMILLFVINRSAGFHPAPPQAISGQELFLEVNSGVQVMVVHYLHTMPLIAFAWEAELEEQPEGEPRLVLSQPRKI